MNKIEERKKVVAEALTWQGTPYHHMGRVKGAGTDCGMLILQVFENCDLIPHIEIPFYPMDWALHRGEPKYLSWVTQYTKEVNREPLPGDIIVHQYGRCISHGGIVVKWPQIIHAYRGIGVVLADADKGELAERQKGIFSYWG